MSFRLGATGLDKGSDFALSKAIESLSNNPSSPSLVPLIYAELITYRLLITTFIAIDYLAVSEC